MRALRLLLLLCLAACELEGPEDKRRDFETVEQAEARHAAERAAAEKRPTVKPDEPLPAGKVVLVARRDGDAVVVDYRGWLACDGNFEMRSSGVADGKLQFVLVDKNTSTQRAACVGPTEVQARVPQVPQSVSSVTVDQGRGYGALTAPVTQR